MSDPDGRDLPRYHRDVLGQVDGVCLRSLWPLGQSVRVLSLATMSRAELAEWIADVVYLEQSVAVRGRPKGIYQLGADLLSAYAATTKPPEGT